MTNSNEAKATPRPWKTGTKDFWPQVIYGVNGDKVVSCLEGGAINENDETALVNAHLIVKAVNNHEALLEACRSALRDVEARGDEDINKYLLAELRQAIANETK